MAAFGVFTRQRFAQHALHGAGLPVEPAGLDNNALSEIQIDRSEFIASPDIDLPFTHICDVFVSWTLYVLLVPVIDQSPFAKTARSA